ncbi:unnamed protein product [Clavelina lepadiformis]|uniref:Uncharacterized protein n=1 Tax=Clavelina lepadiformis TaxID=159417 RepID=A0ABP0FMR0_CLALP
MNFGFGSILGFLTLLAPLQGSVASSGKYDDELLFIETEDFRAVVMSLEGSVCSADKFCYGNQQCQYRWGHPHCYEIFPQPGKTCNDNVCEHNGICQPNGLFSYRCSCPAGVYGYNCDTDSTLCNDQLCKNNGTCITVYGGGARCLCPPGTVGKFCQTLSCSLQCQNGGTCTTSTQGSACKCPPPHTGILCENDPCTYNSCPSARTCVVDLTAPNNFSCLCPSGTIGPNCLPPCTPQCRNGGICVSSNQGNTCDCPPPYTGLDCTDGPCNSDSCPNGGTCIVDLTSPNYFSCLCPSWTIGPNCLPPCTPQCRNGGICVSSNQGNTCDCPPPYTGLDCTDGPCNSDSCPNGGTCIVDLTSPNYFSCLCPSWTIGPNCLPPCTPQCRNGGICVSSNQGNTCDCPPPYTGLDCTDGPCNSDSCPNGGTCIVDLTSPNYFSCLCPSWTIGPNCLPLCIPQCRNGGICVSSNQGNTCDCPPPYTGVDCTNGPCTPDSCRNGATCIVDLTSPNYFRCFCPPATFGPYCQAPCSSSPCQNGGTCIVDLTSSDNYRCDCEEPYFGNHCENSKKSLKNGCSSNPCLGEDCQCFDSCKHEHGYYCISQQGYIGENCNIDPPRLICRHDRIQLDVPVEFYQEYDSNTGITFMYFSSTVDAFKTLQGCQARLIDGRYQLTLFPPFTSCGTAKTQNGNSHIYNNTLWINRRTGSSVYDMPFPILDWSCIFNYDLDIVTSLQPVIDVHRPNLSSVQTYDASLSLCKVSACQQPCPSHLLVKGGAVYTISETIHLSIDLNINKNLFPSSTFIDITSAFLSCSNDPSRTSDTVALSGTGCNINPALDVQLGGTSSQNGACLSFKVPRLQQCTTIYVHLRLRICDPQDALVQYCPSGLQVQHCPARLTKRSTRDDTDVTYHVIGPITVVEKGVDAMDFLSDSGTSVTLGNTTLPGRLVELNHAPNQNGFDTAVTIVVASTTSFVLILLFTLIALLYFRCKPKQVEL